MGGTQGSEGWSNFNPILYSGYGSFPGLASWSTPFASNSGSGNATIDKIANGDGGGPYFGSSGTIYSGGFSGVQNTYGGTLSVLDSAPVGNLKSIVFQLEIGEAFGYDLYSHNLPTLFVNGEAVALVPAFSSLFNQLENGTFTPPGQDPQPLYINTWAFQWDLSSYSSAINSFEIQFSTVQHSQIYAMQLDQSNAINSSSIIPSAIPEPSTYLLMVIGAATLLILRKKRGYLLP